MPNDDVVRRARSNVRDALASQSESWQIPARMSTSEQTYPSVIQKLSLTVEPIDPEKIVPPVDSPEKAMNRSGRTLFPTSEWEGYIESISEDQFSVMLVNVRSKSSLPEDQASFHKSEVSEFDRHLLREGAIVRWVIGREWLPTGQIRNVSELHFRRLPAHTENDYKRAYKKACTLLEGLHWDDEAEG